MLTAARCFHVHKTHIKLNLQVYARVLRSLRSCLDLFNTGWLAVWKPRGQLRLLLWQSFHYLLEIRRTNFLRNKLLVLLNTQGVPLNAVKLLIHVGRGLNLLFDGRLESWINSRRSNDSTWPASNSWAIRCCLVACLGKAQDKIKTIERIVFLGTSLVSQHNETLSCSVRMKAAAWRAADSMLASMILVVLCTAWISSYFSIALHQADQ